MTTQELHQFLAEPPPRPRENQTGRRLCDVPPRSVPTSANQVAREAVGDLDKHRPDSQPAPNRPRSQIAAVMSAACGADPGVLG